MHKEDTLIQAVCKVMRDDMMDSDYTAISEMFELLLDGKDPKETLIGFLPEPVIEDLHEDRFRPLW